MKPGPNGAAERPDLRQLHAKFGDAVRSLEQDAAGEPVVFVAPERNVEILAYLRDSQGYDLLKDVTGLDLGGDRPLQVVYQLWSTRDSNSLRVKAELPPDHLKLGSAFDIWRASNWLEREVYDMFGVVFEGHPDHRRILMPENYEEGYPLRKDFPLRGRFSRAEQTRLAMSQEMEDIYSLDELVVRGRSGAPGEDRGDGIETQNMILNIGPQHPATHGVLRLVCELDGETIVKCTPHIGYLHTGFEKLCEYRTWNQVIPLTDRMDYLAPILYNIGYALGVEELLGIEVTPRCKVIRVICSELNRILSHLIWVGTTAIDIGAFTPFLYTFQERERIYNLHEAYVGARMTTSASRVGGMMADVPPGWLDGVRDFVETFPNTLDETERLLTQNSIWIGRTQGVGTIDGKGAIDVGLCGPNLRASGVAYDVRKDKPYLDYETYDFDVPIGEYGDVYDRYLVRMEEMRQSVRILEQALARVPDGPINVDDPRVILPPKSEVMNSIDGMISHFKLVMEGLKVPAGEVWSSIESSKGELGFYLVADGGPKPVRCRFRGPSFMNISALPYLVEGELIADLIAVNASVDIVLGEIDR
ncbi:MAG: NADH dehydrogenase (quinone) subunit D [Gemmatimonadota bacterium]|nr:MAG: NADH dehydrogenase (quinone) subunit D [Gemmatimonadota bacterium]